MFGLDPDATLRLLIGSLVRSFPGWAEGASEL